MADFKKRVALLCGGNSPEREVSLKGGAAVRKALESRGYQVEVFDPPADLPRLAAQAGEFDLAFLVLHGPGGEDGTIQGFLDSLGLPYQGAGVLGSALAMDKALSKLLYRESGLDVPRAVLLRRGELPSEIPSFPLVVKPASQGSSVGISLVKGEKDLPLALEEAFRFEERVLLEEYVSGRELTVGVLGEEPLPVVEIIPGEGHLFFDYEAKYTPGLTRELCPAPIPEEVARKAQEAALLAHQALRLRHYSRTDFILTPEGRLLVLETNTIPGMTETSLLPLAARVAGLSFEDLVERLVELATTGL
ncbi:MAG: D-alanine--D-alanine ligase [Thermodesulfobacteria bacterium]|nr:D-alanine--D-alanine ligase [Thermodesulfobacteriota bacterium]